MFLWENTFKIPMSEATCTCPLDDAPVEQWEEECQDSQVCRAWRRWEGLWAPGSMGLGREFWGKMQS